jgi:hypothetical protein
LSHINETIITKQNKERYFDFFYYDTCESCLLGKMTKTSFTRKSEMSKELLVLIYINVCGLMNVRAISGYTYFITLPMTIIDMIMCI